jgi:REP element-mobilizing transposase RayT
MTYNPELDHRRSLRLNKFDYSKPGKYFITICTSYYERLFGHVEYGRMILNKYGSIANEFWLEIPKHFDNATIDEFIVMPNHLHGIIILNDKNIRRDTACRVPASHDETKQIERFGKPTKNTIPTIIRSYKSAVTKQINILRKSPGFSVWQKNYYEHIIRNDKEYHLIKDYIINNPVNWEFDENNIK